MSKRNSSSGSSNTLFNYFVKSPASKTPQKSAADTNKNEKVSPLQTVSNGNVKRKNKEKIKEQSSNESAVESDNESNKKKPKLSEEEEDEIPEIEVTRKRKRIRLISEDSDSDTENSDVPDISVRDKLENSFKFEAKSSSPASSPVAKSKNQNKSKLNDSKDASLSETKTSDAIDSDSNWIHCQLDWLKPGKLRDAARRKPDDPDYDPKTLYVPEDFKSKQTPAHKQWWDIKSSHYDCVLFFKVGKFYELYHMDAAVGVNELGFSYMKGEFAHSGFPETAYSRMASSLVQKGYKVARVEQTETPDMMQERTKKLSGKEKVVRREICQVTCKGIEVFGLLDSGPPESSASYMMAISEQHLNEGCSAFGICFVDTSIGVFHLGQFDDDNFSSRLLTTVAHHPPALILYERGNITKTTESILKDICPTTRKEALAPEKEFWSAQHTLKVLADKYFLQDKGVNWPEGLKPMLSDTDRLGLTPAEKKTLSIRALGACVSYLTDTLLDIQVMGMARFEAYFPPDMETESPKTGKAPNTPTNMVLDSFTLENLHILGSDSSLLSKLDNCTTPMGKRLLQQWVCAPSCNVEVIMERQKAISSLLEDQSAVQDVRAVLNTLPDMERLLTKIHTLGNLNRSKNHPDSKAILYEMKTYSKRKVIDFISILNGFQAAINVMKRFNNTNSTLLKRITQYSPDGQYPDYAEILNFFKGAFDHALAEKEGTILPEKGVDSEYDTAVQDISEIKSELDKYLNKQEKYFNCKVTYFGSDKKRFQLEVPESKCSKAGSSYNFEGTRKGFKRFSTSETKDLLARMIAAEDHLQSVLKDLSRRIFEKFSQSHTIWYKAISCIAILDVIISLAEYTRLQSCDMCIPKLVTGDVKPFISITDGRHPCIASKESEGMDDYIPNDTHLGVGDEASLILLTGPNMGGKSTLMRQLGLLTIMTQMGCHVPASECSITIVDRIFTRLGAHDDIMTGQSTFFVELSETAAILKHATPHSLILIDELGRGTSTYDGTAIAAAVLDDLCHRRCRTIFSTHYHMLVESFKTSSAVSLAHMACMVETDESAPENADSVTQETVTFMYKLSAGACPKSYGFNAARLAGIGRSITRKAHEVSIEMEKEASLVAMFKKLCGTKPKNEEENLRELLHSCRNMIL